MNFPPNPEDKTIYEASIGVYYQFDKKQNTWVLLDNYGLFITPATSLQDGLMTSDDYIKVQGLLLPPPQTTIGSDQCKFVFTEGTFGFRSSLDDLNIEYELTLMDRNKDGNRIETKKLYHIHENTYGINFTINLQRLVDELVKRGKLHYNKKIGLQGAPGIKGLPGRDRLDTGPVGDKGPNGKNAPWPGQVSEDPIAIASDPGRGIVDITTEEVSDTENYIVVTRANIANTQYCPEFVNPQPVNSPWVVAIDEKNAATKLFQECDISRQCGFDTCGIKTIIIPICASILYYVDFTTIESTIKDQFQNLLNQMKSAKEQIAAQWLQQLMSTFTNQKAALCCALGNARATTANRQAREFVESMRIQAAVGGLQLVVDGNPQARTTEVNVGGVTPTPISEVTTINPPNIDFVCPPLEVLNIDCSKNNNTTNALAVELDSGDYTVEITNCCCKNANGYTGAITIQYNNNGNQVNAFIASVDGSSFKTQQQAEAYYLGASVAFHHEGGTILIFCPCASLDPFQSCASGSLQAVIRETDCVQQVINCASTPVLTDITNLPIGDFTCDMNLEQILWYEAGWRTGACCGAYVNIGGTGWIVVKRSLGNDITCGGGESVNTPCIGAALKVGFHPAIAFPTINGEEFIGKPTSMQKLMRNMDLESAIMAKISDGTANKIKGDPINNFQGILFPADLMI